jgi:hypothetical protein
MITTHPTWHHRFFDELNDLSDNMFNSISFRNYSKQFTIRIEFHYKLYMSLTFYDEPTIAQLIIHGDMWYYEYSDPKFTPKTIFDTIKERTERWTK